MPTPPIPPTPRKIVLATFGSHGDVHPFVGLAKTLQSRGHHVTLHTSNYFQSLAQSAGIPFSGFGTPEEFLAGLNNPLAWHPFHGPRIVLGELVAKVVRKSYDALRPLITKDTILVGSSIAFSARIIHDETRCPGATVHLAPAVMRSCIDPPKLMGLFAPNWLPLWFKRKAWETGDRFVIDPLVCPSVNELRASINLPPVRRVLDEWWNHPNLIIGMWEEFFGRPIADWPKQLQLAGFPLYDESDLTPLTPDLQAFLQANPNPIAFTPGSAMVFGQKFFAAAVEACQKLSRPGLLLSRHLQHIPASLPPTVKHVPYAPFSQLLPQCAAIVHHGGIGTTSQALKAGIPQLITHFSHDQPDNAHRLTRLGVGTGIPAKKATGKKMAKLLGALLSNPHTLKAAQNLAPQVRPNGLLQAAEMLEALGSKTETPAMAG